MATADLKLEKFRSKIAKTYPKTSVEVLEGLNTKRLKSFRINTLKANTDSVLSSLKSQGFSISDGPFDNSYFVVSEPGHLKLSETDEVNTGQIYIQNPSSMIPAFVLEPQPGEKILDMCAAPGSKTTLIAELTGDKAEVTAVEKNKSRFFKLKEILQIRGINNVDTKLLDATTLSKRYPEYLEYFDKILLDVPCSGEGTISLGDKDALKFWNQNKYKQFIGLQRALIAAAYQLLKTGGTLVYSTCTFSPEENEMIVNWAIKKIEGLKVTKLQGYLEHVENKIEGFTSWGHKELDQSLNHTVRIIPNEIFEGFYVAKMIKM